MAALACSNFVRKSPIIVVVGATGTGKSQLAIELALKFKGEVISADSMQVYKGLDIATNKVTVEEQMGVKHHLLGFLDPMKNLKVPEFRNLALEAIRDVLKRKKLPIIVGGTNYYIESILYNVLVDGTMHDDRSEEEEPVSEAKRPRYSQEEFYSTVEKANNVDLHRKLMDVDPEMANILHPNNRRKIIRCLQVYEQHGETMSAILKRQRSVPGGCDLGGPLRFTNCLVLWLQCKSETLNSRLDARVDKMISQGLVNEFLDFHARYNRGNSLDNLDEPYTKGILQAIGFKEFRNYFTIDEENRKSEEGQKILKVGIDMLKTATRQYAKRQCKWIRNRFLRSIDRQVPPIYGLDATDLDKWSTNVYEVAENIVQCHITGMTPPVEPLPMIEGKNSIDRTYFCEICDKILVGIDQWNIHVNSKKHARVVKKKNKLKKAQENSGDTSQGGDAHNEISNKESNCESPSCTS